MNKVSARFLDGNVLLGGSAAKVLTYPSSLAPHLGGQHHRHRGTG